MKLPQSPAQRRAAQAEAASRYRAHKKLGDQIAVSLGATVVNIDHPAPTDPYDAAYDAAHPDLLAQWKLDHPYLWSWTDAMARAWASGTDPFPTSQAEADAWAERYRASI